MKHSLLFGGNFLLTEPRKIEVVDFKAWRKVMKNGENRKRRRFSPRLTLNVAGVLLNLVGYARVWAFLDELIPDLPRKPVNLAMKGYEFYDNDVLPFALELRAFIEESEQPCIAFNINTVGHSKVVKKGTLHVPIRMKERAGEAELTLFEGNYTFCLLESKDKPTIYIVYCLGKGVRPLKGRVFTSVDLATDYILTTAQSLAGEKRHIGDFTIRHGMFDEEIDKLENEAFFSCLEL